MAVPVKVRLVPMCVASHRRFHYLYWLRSRLTIHHYLLTTHNSPLRNSSANPYPNINLPPALRIR